MNKWLQMGLNSSLATQKRYNSVEPDYDYEGTGVISAPWVNVGAMENKGFEFTLNTMNITKPNLTWKTGITFSLNRNKVTAIYTETADLTGTINGNKKFVALPTGKTVKENEIWYGDYIWEDLNGDGVIDEQDRTDIGNTLDAYGDWITGTSPKDYETAWGNPQITPQLIAAYKSAGVKALRLPVTWRQHIDAEGNVDADSGRASPTSSKATATTCSSRATTSCSTATPTRGNAPPSCRPC